jgi:B12-binding domain/radical SAM domain protein
MYPLGFLTMVDYLERRGLRVRVVNLALRMINDVSFDVPRFLSRLEPRAFGIDLHWLPHAHGSIEIARLLKQIHPQIPVIFGGLSASYFHRELIEDPAVDYVLRGDSVEPQLYQLLKHVRSTKLPERVPNLTWKSDGRVRINPKSLAPVELDAADLAPERMIKMVLRHRDLQSVLPFNGWWQNPITAVFTVKGCAHECVTCGGSQSACGFLNARKGPIFRSPGNLVANIRAISRISRGPIFLVGDLRQASDGYEEKVLELLGREDLPNQIVFELFEMPPLDYLRRIDAAVRNWSLELSPESHDPAVRGAQDSTTSFDNSEMEAVIAEAMRLRCQRVDVFFMIGLPQQTMQSVMESIQYCEHLFQSFDARLSCFISPMGPFLDPGSRGFEDPEKYGYRLFAHTLEEHRQLLVQPSWDLILNYETKWMTRRQLVDVTYDAAEKLNALKLQYGRIGPTAGRAVARHIGAARDLRARLDATEDQNSEPTPELLGEIHEFSVSTVCDKRELFWRRHIVNFHLLNILRISLSYLFGR